MNKGERISVVTLLPALIWAAVAVFGAVDLPLIVLGALLIIVLGFYASL